MILPSFTLLGLLINGASAGGLSISAGPPPRQVGVDTWRFADRVELLVLPAVVLHLEAGALPPPGAHSLGGRSWRLDTTSPTEAVALALALSGSPGVSSAWPDVVLPRAAASFDDPEREGQWYLEELEMDLLYARSLGDPDTRVVVIDSAIDIAHTDLAAGVDAPYDAYSDDEDPSPNPGEYCAPGDGDSICDGHGTAVSGIIAARANNGFGMVGLCPECTLVPVKMLGEGLGGGALSADVAAFEHAIAQDAAVINNSWGFTTSIPVPQPLAEVIERAATETRGGLGALVVFAAGNDDREIDDDEMQALPYVLCVSATDRYGNPTAYTNEGASVDLAAPSATFTLAPGDEMTTTFGGTSAAAPVVSGVAAWALSVAPQLSAAELRQLLVDTAVPSPLVTADEEGHHPVYGYGELDAVGLMEALLGEEEDSGLAPSDPEGCGGCASSPPRRSWLALLGVLPLALRRRREGAQVSSLASSVAG